MEQSLTLLRRTRATILRTTADLSEEQLHRIPEGFGNNILWNIGHLVVSQQFLTYELAGLPKNISQDWWARFAEGSSPKHWQGRIDTDELLESSLSLIDKTQHDWEQGLFADLPPSQTSFPYTTSFGGDLNSVLEALHYNNFHEGVHYGTIRALRRIVA